MATEDLNRLLRIPAKLVLAPTSFAGAFPFGGTQLGAALDIAAFPRAKNKELRSEEHGTETVEVVRLGQSWKVAAAFRGWDDTALGAVFDYTTTGAASKRKLVEYPGTFVPGALGSAGATGLLVAADDYLRQPSIYLPKAVLLLDEGTELTYSLAEEGVYGLVALALRRASDVRAYQWGLLKDFAI